MRRTITFDNVDAKDIEAHAFGTPDMLCRPCVDCGLRTGNYCDGDELGVTGVPCLAVTHCATEVWANGQRTPFLYVLRAQVRILPVLQGCCILHSPRARRYSFSLMLTVCQGSLQLRACGCPCGPPKQP